MPRRNLHILVVVMVVSFICYHRADSAHRSRYGTMFETFVTTLGEIKDRCLYEVDERKLFEGAMSGLVRELDDPYSAYQGEAKTKVKKTFQVVSEGCAVVKSSGASLGLSTEASLDGVKVLLNSPQQATDTIIVETPVRTRIELLDQHGKPIPYQRFRIALPDGSEYSGSTGEDGCAEADVDQAGEIVFPDLAEVESV